MSEIPRDKRPKMGEKILNGSSRPPKYILESSHVYTYVECDEVGSSHCQAGAKCDASHWKFIVKCDELVKVGFSCLKSMGSWILMHLGLLFKLALYRF